MTLEIKLTAHPIWWIRTKPAETVTEEDIAAALAEMQADPRVEHVAYMGRVANGRPAFDIRATDTQEGDLVGIYSIGRCLNALSETHAGHATRVAGMRAETAARFAEMQALEAEKQAEKQAERENNLRRLKARGINPGSLAWYVNAIAGGRYVDPQEPIADDFAWYLREIVRGRPQPMRLGLYLANFTD